MSATPQIVRVAKSKRGKKPGSIKVQPKVIRHWLIDHNVMIKELASQMGIHPGSLNNILHGHTGISLPVLVLLADVTGLSLDVLIGRATGASCTEGV